MTKTLGRGTTLVSLQMVQNWEEVSDTQDICPAIQRSFNRLQKWAGRNLMKIKKKKMQTSCTCQRLTPCTSTVWGPTSWKAALKQEPGISDGCQA